MAEQPPLLGRRERRAAGELERRGRRRAAAPPRAASSAAQPRVELRRLAAERRDPDRVLEQPARVGVVVVGVAGNAARSRSASTARTVAAQPRVRELVDEELEEPLQLRRRRGGAPASGVAGSTSAASSVRTSSCSRSRNFSTRPSTRTASPSPKRPSSSSTSFQTRASMRPRRVDELEREVRRAALRAQPPLRLDGEDALDDAVLRPGRRSPRRVYAASLRPCPGSRRFARSATTRRSPGRSTTWSRRPTT